jgi:hypothetical protein
LRIILQLRHKCLGYCDSYTKASQQEARNSIHWHHHYFGLQKYKLSLRNPKLATKNVLLGGSTANIQCKVPDV